MDFDSMVKPVLENGFDLVDNYFGAFLGSEFFGVDLQEPGETCHA